MQNQTDDQSDRAQGESDLGGEATHPLDPLPKFLLDVEDLLQRALEDAREQALAPPYQESFLDATRASDEAFSAVRLHVEQVKDVMEQEASWASWMSRWGHAGVDQEGRARQDSMDPSGLGQSGALRDTRHLPIASPAQENNAADCGLDTSKSLHQENVPIRQLGLGKPAWLACTFLEMSSLAERIFDDEDHVASEIVSSLLK